MTDENIQIIEINGIKMEVDMRHATRIDKFKIGSKVKVLSKKYSSHEVYHGVIVGFDNFKCLPTIIVAYLNVTYSDCKLEFAYINADTKDTELVLSVNDEMPLNKADLYSAFEKERAKLKEQILDIDRKQDYFTRHFNQYFNDADLHQTITETV